MSGTDPPTTDSLPTPILPTVDDEFYKLLVANTSEGLLTIDSNSKIIFANPAIEDILGYEPSELIGSSKLEIIPDRLRHVHERRLNTYLETGNRSIDWSGVELPALHKDGHEVPVMISLREHRYEGTRLFTGLFRDISSLKAQEDQLRTKNQQLERFASLLSHDLRNPLSVIQGYASLSADEVGVTELQEISRAAGRMDELIGDMLTHSQNETAADSTAAVDLESIARSSWRWTQADDATLVVADDSETVRGDPSRIKSLLENLFRNAIEHGGPNVTVEVGPLEHGRGFYVQDDGTGVPDDVGDTIFEHGYTTSADGTGLGLSIVDRIAATHGWDVRLRESDAGGCRFEFGIDDPV